MSETQEPATPTRRKKRRTESREPTVRVQAEITASAKADLVKFAGPYSFGVAIEELLRRERRRQHGTPKGSPPRPPEPC